MPGDIILGYDGLHGAASALPVAVTVAKAFDATLAVVFGYEPNPMGGETKDYELQLKKIAQDAVNDAVARAKALDPSVKAEAEIVALRPVEALLAVAEERQARVIVVGG